MTRIRNTVLGDLLEAFKHLSPDDDATRAAIAELLGLGWRAADKTTTKGDKQAVSSGKSSGEEDRTEGTPKPLRRSHAMPNFTKPGRHPPVLASAQPDEHDEDSVTEPAWLLAVNPLPISRQEQRPEPEPRAPLLEPVRTRALLTDLLASDVADGPIDVRALEERICRVEPIIELPRLKRRSLGLGIEVLVDRAEALTPFFADQVALLERIRSLAGAENTRVLRFARNPLQGAGPGGRRTWKRWTPPKPARPLLLLTDLGLLDVAHLGMEEPATATADDWELFAKSAQAGGCPVLALVPYPRSRWSDDRDALFPILSWHRRLSLKDLRQALGRRWAVTG